MLTALTVGKKYFPNLAIRLVPLLFVSFWSVGAIFIKIGLIYTNPFTFLLLRLIIASLAMLFLAFVMQAPWPRNFRLLCKIIGAGLLLQFFYLAAFSCAVYNNVSPSIMTIILALQPILTVILSTFILNDVVYRIQWIGLKIGFIGVFLVIMRDLSVGNMTWAGFVFSIISLVSITLGSLVQKNIKEMNLLTGSAIQLTISIIPTAILTAIFGNFVIPTAPLFLISLAWVALIVSVSSTYIYYSLLKSKHIITTTSLFYLVPPFTAFLCYLVFNEKITIYSLVGILLVVIGIFATNYSPKKGEIHAN